MQEIEVFISVITSIVTFITLIYNLGIKKSIKREAIYYKKVLQPFILKLSQNSEVNAIKIVKKLAERDNDNIPKYITFLIDNGESDILKKVLICDYIELYPNDSNDLTKIINSAAKLMYYLLIFLSLFLIVVGTIIVTDGLVDLCSLRDGISLKIMYKNVELLTWQWHLVRSICGVICWGASILILKYNRLTNTDRYALSKNKIKNMINKKVKKYPLIYNKHIL